jgi:hypothetical protein
MRIDYEYMSKILDVFLEASTPTVTWDDFEPLREGSDEGEHRFVFHIEILADKGLVVGGLDDGSIGIQRNSGEYLVSVIPWRLTADGHDFAAALVKPGILDRIKEKFQKEALSTVIEIAKKLAEKQAEKLLGE